MMKQETKQEVLRFIIETRLWHDKKNGNTYHSVRIYKADDFILLYSSGLVYGYGEQYRQTAYDFLIKSGLAKEEDRFNHELNRIRFLFIEPKYVNKKDL